MRAFHSVLDGLGTLDYPVEVVPLGDDISTAFGPRSARRPDIVMLPQPGWSPSTRMTWNPCRTTWPTRPGPALGRAAGLDGTTYGVPFKTAHKSAVWYRPSVFSRRDCSRRRLDRWLELNRALSLEGSGRSRWALETAGC